ncbi:MAG: hypothetical protein AAB799_02585 [Patescibacteria group bacterium]
MLKNVANLLNKKQKTIENEIVLKSILNTELRRFIKEEVLKNKDIGYNLTYTLNKDILKIEVNNKIIAQEIALRIRLLEVKLRNRGISFKKLLI